MTNLATLFSSVLTLAAAQGSTPAPDALHLDAVDAAVKREFERLSLPGAVVGIVQGDELVYQVALGHRDVERGLAMTTDLGMTAHQYLLSARLDLARKLLRRGRAPTQVASAAGFADQAHLTRVFERVYGMTPGRYRRSLRDAEEDGRPFRRSADCGPPDRTGSGGW